MSSGWTCMEVRWGCGFFHFRFVHSRSRWLRNRPEPCQSTAWSRSAQERRPVSPQAQKQHWRWKAWPENTRLIFVCRKVVASNLNFHEFEVIHRNCFFPSSILLFFKQFDLNNFFGKMQNQQKVTFLQLHWNYVSTRLNVRNTRMNEKFDKKKDNVLGLCANQTCKK